MDIPVYLITGFLDAGKTDFINGILKDGFRQPGTDRLLQAVVVHSPQDVADFYRSYGFSAPEGENSIPRTV